MSIYKNKSGFNFWAIVASQALNLWLASICLTPWFVGFSYAGEAGQDEGAVREQSQSETTVDETLRGKIFNLYGREMGKVDPQGKISNAYGSKLGYVDSNGTIFNVSNIEIGKVSGDGTIINQSGTVLGSANGKGEIFNVSGNKLGEVKGVSDVHKIGAAGRLIFFRKRQ
jgi:hypothetical protein